MPRTYRVWRSPLSAMMEKASPSLSRSAVANERSTTTPSDWAGSSQRPSATTGCATRGGVAGIARSAAGSFLPSWATVTGADVGAGGLGDPVDAAQPDLGAVLGVEPHVGAVGLGEQAAPRVGAVFQQGDGGDQRGHDPGHGEHGEQRLAPPGPQVGPDPAGAGRHPGRAHRQVDHLAGRARTPAGDAAVVDDRAVEKRHQAVREGGHAGVVGDHDDGLAVLVHSLSSRITSRVLRLSRLPVGSSASSTLGWLTSARASATRCCSPPESSPGAAFAFARVRAGRPVLPGGVARLAEGAARAARAVPRCRHGQVGDQVEELEDEADPAAPQ